MTSEPTASDGPTGPAWPPSATGPVTGATSPEHESAHVGDPYVSTLESDGAGSPGPGDVVKDEAAQVKDTAVGAGQQVAETAKTEASNVVGEAKEQAQGLVEQVKGEAGHQAGAQQQRLAGLAHSYAKELGSMASGSDETGPLTDLAHQASRRAGEFGHWLEDHEPAELLDEVRAFARRRPVAFLLGAAAAGVVVGRLTRGLASNAKAEHDASPGAAVRDVTTEPSVRPALLPATESAPFAEPSAAPVVPENDVTYGSVAGGYRAGDSIASGPTDDLGGPTR